MEGCPYTCDIVERSDYDGERLPSAYIFHGRNILACDLPERYSHQLMVLLLFEPPPNAGIFRTELPVDYFNATMTYRNDSDYPYPYGIFVKRTGNDIRETVITKEEMSFPTFGR
ncbi:hypothetical protein COOONC_06076 [Cooperia oncophora]